MHQVVHSIYKMSIIALNPVEILVYRKTNVSAVMLFQKSSQN